MKNTILTLGVALTALTTSCGSVSPQAPKDQKDTVGYAIGVFTAVNIERATADSAFNTAIAFEAINDVFNGNEKKMKDAQIYAIASQFAQEARRGVDSTINPAVIAAGIADYMKKTNTVKPEEAGEYIMKYVNNLQAKKMEEEAAAGIEQAEEFLATVDAIEGVQKTASGLRYKIENQGEGNKVDSNSLVVVKYALYDYNDNVLDSGDAFQAQLPGGVVKGFEEGLKLLAKGGKATIWMPADLGYGIMGSGPIKQNQALKFDIEIVDINPAK